MEQKDEELLEKALGKIREMAYGNIRGLRAAMEPENRPGDLRIDRAEQSLGELKHKADKILNELYSDVISGSGGKEIVKKNEPS